jgi:hypothetical protein
MGQGLLDCLEEIYIEEMGDGTLSPGGEMKGRAPDS